MGWTEYFQGRFFLLPEVQQIENAPCRSRRIDKSAGNAWDLSIPSEHFGKILYLLTVLNLSYKIGISALLPYYYQNPFIAKMGIAGEKSVDLKLSPAI